MKQLAGDAGHPGKVSAEGTAVHLAPFAHSSGARLARQASSTSMEVLKGQTRPTCWVRFEMGNLRALFCRNTKNRKSTT